MTISPRPQTVAIIDYGSGNLHSAAKAFERAAREGGTNARIVVTSDAAEVAKADRIVLPGVGAYADCKAGLLALPGMREAMEDVVLRDGRPFLGICVGMQLLATRGHEFTVTDGLNWIEGEVRVIKPQDPALKIPHMGWNTLNLTPRNTDDTTHATQTTADATPANATATNSTGTNAAGTAAPATQARAPDATNANTPNADTTQTNATATEARHPLLAGISTGERGLHAYFVHSYQLVAADPGVIVATTSYGGPVTAMVARGNIAGTQFHPEKSQTLGLRLISNFLVWKP